MKSLCLVLASTFMSCASIMHGTKQQIPIDSNPTGAEVIIVDEEGFEVFNGMTPSVITLRRDTEYKVTIKKDGYGSFTTLLKRKIDGWYWGNIGLLGIGIIGAAVDIANGAAYKLSPAQIVVSLPKTDSSQIHGNDQTILVVQVF